MRFQANIFAALVLYSLSTSAATFPASVKIKPSSVQNATNLTYICAPGDGQLPNSAWNESISIMEKKYGKAVESQMETRFSSWKFFTWKTGDSYTHICITTLKQENRAIFVTAKSSKSSKPEIELPSIKSKLNVKLLQIPVPPYKQFKNCCGPAAAAAILRFRGCDISEGETASLLSTIQSDNLHNDETKVKQKNPVTIEQYGIKDVRIKHNGNPNQLHSIFKDYAEKKIPLQLWLTPEGNRDLAKWGYTGHSVVFVGYDPEKRIATILNNESSFKCKVDLLAKNLQPDIHDWIPPKTES